MASISCLKEKKHWFHLLFLEYFSLYSGTFSTIWPNHKVEFLCFFLWDVTWTKIKFKITHRDQYNLVLEAFANSEISKWEMFAGTTQKATNQSFQSISEFFHKRYPSVCAFTGRSQNVTVGRSLWTRRRVMTSLLTCHHKLQTELNKFGI